MVNSETWCRTQSYITPLTEVKGCFGLDLITLGCVFSDGGSKVEATITILLTISETADTRTAFFHKTLLRTGLKLVLL